MSDTHAKQTDSLSASAIEKERLFLERERLRSERQKLAIEARLKRREIAGKTDKTLKELLANPLTLAIAGGFVTIMTTIVTTSYTASENRTAENLRAKIALDSANQTLQAELLKKFVESPKTETVRENLRFLVDAGLLPDYAERISRYLKENPESAPTVGAGSPLVPPIVGAMDQRIPLASAPPDVREKFRGLGKIRVQASLRSSPDFGSRECTGFLAAPKIVIIPELCLGNAEGSIATFEPTPFSADATVGPSHSIVDLERRVVFNKIVLAPLRDGENSANPYIPLETQPPREGLSLGMAFFAQDLKSWVYSAGPNCHVTKFTPNEVQHLCDTGIGSAGAPILTPSGRVIGVHTRTGEKDKSSLRADFIRDEHKVIEAFGQLPLNDSEYNGD